MNIKIELNPTESHLKVIKGWLQNEYKKNGEGFFGNWNSILKSFENKNIITYQNENETIGFATFEHSNGICAIEIFCIQMKNRGKGYGGKFLQELEQYFIDKQIIAIELFCAPIESETFWLNKNYIKAPDTDYNYHKLTYWKPLIPIQKTTNYSNCLNKIELWNVVSIDSKINDPKWTWEISVDCLNILQYSYYDWNLRITINGTVINESKAKWITGKCDELIISPYLFIPHEYIEKLLKCI